MGKVKIVFLLVVVFCLGLLIGIFKDSFIKSNQNPQIEEIRATGYKYISPLRRVDFPQSKNDSRLFTLKEEVEKYISDTIDQKKASHISVYFRNPAHNRWFSINDKDKYTPASVMKLVTLMAFLKQAETDPELFKKQISYDKSETLGGYNFPPEKDIEIGRSYSIDELLSYMITYSSNNAMTLLIKNLDSSYINRVLEDLQLEQLNYDKTENFMNIYTYASFFRTLYSATYLSEPMSERALELLTKTTFDEGLKRGVPENIAIAHKFGERNNLDNGTKQLHDCGKIYYPKNHYLLCIMTRGSSFDDLKQVIQAISAITYRQVNSWKDN